MKRQFMKQLSMILLAFGLIMSGCSSESTQESYSNLDNDSVEYSLDYTNAESFEQALNNGTKVNGKIVQFEVNEYKPDSALGINCWSGEHLNFISEDEIDVNKGDIIIGRITEEPSKFLGSWKIPYEPLSVRINKNESYAPDLSIDEETIASETTSYTVPENQVYTPVSHKETVGMSGEDVAALFAEAGFINISLEELKLDYDPEVSYKSGYCKSVSIGGEYFFDKNIPYDAEVSVIVLYVTYPEGVSPTTDQYTETEPPATEEKEHAEMVWITYSGSKYHSKKDVVEWIIPYKLQSKKQLRWDIQHVSVAINCTELFIRSNADFRVRE